MQRQVSAFILAGGMGTRLRSAIGELPKSLAPVAGRPFIWYLLNRLRRQGISDITLCLGYQAGAIIKALGSGASLGIQLQYSIEQEPLGTGGALKYAVQNHSGPIIAMNGDTYLEFSVDSLLGLCQPEENSVVLMLKKAKNANLRGCVDLASDGFITSFVEKPDSVSDEVLISAGVYLFNQVDSIQDFPSVRFSMENDFFPSMAKDRKLLGTLTENYFIDIGIPESLKQFEMDIIGGKIDDY